ncbi:hypothetical protein [Corynebacterium sputi]|uniref:hypothetical protein n=1 Tax=Corynebacterium sputi TaxID=489915 RepID=UPI00040E475F|nr:hypothetical protein [Corynebacterium sputi]
MANHFDFYSSLELDSALSSNSLNEEIQGRLNRLSADGAPEASAEVQQLLIAAKILSDEELRSRYDDRLADEYAPAMGAGDLRVLAAERRFPDEVPAMASPGPSKLSASASPMPPPAPAQSHFPPSGPITQQAPQHQQAPQQTPAGPSKIGAILVGAPGVVRGYFWTMFGIGAFSLVAIFGNIIGLFLETMGVDIVSRRPDSWFFYLLVVGICLNAVSRANRVTSSLFVGALSLGLALYALWNVVSNFLWMTGSLSTGFSVLGFLGSIAVLFAAGASTALILLPSTKQWFAPVQ